MEHDPRDDIARARRLLDRAAEKLDDPARSDARELASKAGALGGALPAKERRLNLFRE